jgi:hypothetical protein
MIVTSLLTRSLIFFTLAIVWYFNVLLIAVPLTFWYMYNFRAFELIALGLLIDVYFWSPALTPYYTVGFLAAVAFMELLKPRLRKNELL